MRKLKNEIHSFLWSQLKSASYPRHVYYIGDANNWSTFDDGLHITRHLQEARGVKAELRTHLKGVVHGIVHLGSLPGIVWGLNSPWLSYNRCVGTVFHGNFGIDEPTLEANLRTFLSNQHVFEKVVTSCSFMTERLLSWGVKPSKLSQIPLGVDVAACQQASKIDVTGSRRRLGISDDEFCVGSWQKDGVGWGDGYEPKLVKGPDVYVEVLARLQARGCKVRALLTGPARGYVKRALEARGIPFIHRSFDDRNQLLAFMKLADLCLVTSREEGGPKAVLEAIALGVPLVSTRVGLAPDVIEHQVTGFLTPIDDVGGLTEAAMQIAASPELSRDLRSAARLSAQHYDWACIADRYLKEVYQPLFGPA